MEIAVVQLTDFNKIEKCTIYELFEILIYIYIYNFRYSPLIQRLEITVRNVPDAHKRCLKEMLAFVRAMFSKVVKLLQLILNSGKSKYISSQHNATCAIRPSTNSYIETPGH